MARAGRWGLGVRLPPIVSNISMKNGMRCRLGGSVDVRQKSMPVSAIVVRVMGWDQGTAAGCSIRRTVVTGDGRSNSGHLGYLVHHAHRMVRTGHHGGSGCPLRSERTQQQTNDRAAPKGSVHRG